MSFKLKTILGIVIVEAILLVVIVFGSLNFLTTSNERLFKDRVDITADLFTIAIKDAVISYDLATLDSFVNEITSHPEIKYTQILDSSKRALITYQAKDYFPEQNSSSNEQLYWIQQDIIENGQVYGKVKIGVSNQELSHAREEALSWWLGLASIEILLVAVLSFILGTYLTKQIFRLTEASNQIKQHGPGHIIENSSNPNDEIGQVINAFNQMSIELENTYKEQNDSLLEYLELYQLNQQTNAQNQAILDASLDSIVTINAQGIIVEFNHVAEQTFGWKAKEIIGKSATNTIIPPRYRATHKRLLAHYNRTQKASVLDKVMQLEALHKDGRSFPIEISISKLNLDNDTFFTSFIRDITERINNENEIKLSATAIESGDALIITDADLKILRVNHAYTLLTGYQSEEVINTKARLFDKKVNPLYKEMWQSLNTQGQWNGSIIKQNKQGDSYHVRISVSAVKNQNEQISHYVIHLVDISEVKETEEKLKKAQARAEKANLAKSQFLANMSHEIRSPLNSIITVNELLLQSELSELSEEAANLVAISLSGGRSLMNIINDVLDFSKIEAGEMPLKLSQFNITHLVEETLDLFKYSAQEQNIHLIYIVEPDLNLCFSGDQIRVKQILTNLVNNAIKFTHQGGVSIHLKNSRQKGLIIEVQDTGVGLSKEDANKVFSKFFQADDSNTKKYEGTGLGLAIVHSLAKLMGGDISLTSELGKGSCFRVELPLEIDINKTTTVQDRLNQRSLITELLLVSQSRFLQENLEKQLSLFNISVLPPESLTGRKKLSRPLVAIFAPPYSEQLDQDLALIAERLESECQAYILIDPASQPEISPLPFNVSLEPFPLHFDHLLSLLSNMTPSLEHTNKLSAKEEPLIAENHYEGITILIVEDSKINQVIAENILDKKGYQHESANNGLEALEKSNQQSYDLILMDMRMPIMDGLEATKKIRSNPGPNQNTPILAMTANAFTQDEEACLNAGMNDFITKPIDIQYLYQKIEFWLNSDHPLERDYKEPIATPTKDDFKLSSAAKIYHDFPSADILNTEIWQQFKHDVGEELLLSILEVYLQETSSRLALMMTLWKDSELQNLSNEAHVLKSSSGSFGFTGLQALAQEIEISCSEMDEARVNDAMQKLSKCSQATLSFAKRYLKKNTPE